MDKKECKTCWYYREHNGNVDCSPENIQECLANLFDK